MTKQKRQQWICLGNELKKNTLFVIYTLLNVKNTEGFAFICENFENLIYFVLVNLKSNFKFTRMIQLFSNQLSK
jgi:hypothetical protein